MLIVFKIPMHMSFCIERLSNLSLVIILQCLFDMLYLLVGLIYNFCAILLFTLPLNHAVFFNHVISLLSDQIKAQYYL